MREYTEDVTSQYEALERIVKLKNIHKILYKTVKRFFDIFFSIIGLLFMLPLTMFVYIGNMASHDIGPVFYKQKRLGKNGKHFYVYKFRTMIVNADDVISAYLAEHEEAREEFKKYYKLQNDPRVTKFGRFLRKASIDEVPQFINVLKGEMSLIGPRPIVDAEVPFFGDDMELIHSIKPGITGYWAANGRSDVWYDERVKMEAFYASHCSLLLDTKIFFKTIIQVLKKNGAV